MINNAKRYYQYRLKLEKLKRDRRFLDVLSRLLCFLALLAARCN